MAPTIKLATLVALLLCISTYLADAVVNNKIDRIIDLTSQLVKIKERIHLDENPGTYQIKLEPSHDQRLSYIDASIDGHTLPVHRKSGGTYDVDLTGKSIDQPLVVLTVYTKLLELYPAEIAQHERQLVRYSGLQTTLSPYLTKTTTTKVKLPQSSRLESFTKANKMATGSSQITYGPFKDVPADQAEKLVIHYENNSPFAAITELKRIVEVSPWAGYINIENQVKVTHVGAKLKGPFSRIEYQRDHSNGLSAIKNFATELPKSAADIYYRDGIGNISTSTVRTTSQNVIVNLKPRFTIFGGWGTDFNLGYRVPLKDFINQPTSSDKYKLSIPFADILYENMFIEDAQLKIILPAGSTVENTGPYERLTDEFSYFHMLGKPVLSIRRQNLVRHHLDGKPIIIEFNYNYNKPMIAPLVATLTILFVSVNFVLKRF